MAEQHKEGVDSKSWSGYTIGLNFAVSAVIAMLFGAWLDGQFGWKPWGMLVGLFLGMAAGFRVMWQAMMKDSSEDENEEEKTDKSDA